MRPEFLPFGKIPRLLRDIIITEKLDGTNASVTITEEGEIYAGSRNRYITPEGVVIFHANSRSLYKITLDGDGHKGADE